MFKIEVKGIKELQQKFEEINIKLKDVLYQATANAGAVVVREAKINSGRGGEEFPHRITGNLMRSIKEIRKTSTDDKCEVQVGSAMDYALRLEYGFNGTDSLGRRYHQAPRPYLRPALDEHKDEAKHAFDLKFQEFLRMLK